MGFGRAVVRFLVLGAVSALLIVLGARLREEILSMRRREGTPKDLERAQEVAEAYESELNERDRIVLPGISIRS
jgi:hypothetical protein